MGNVAIRDLVQSITLFLCKALALTEKIVLSRMWLLVDPGDVHRTRCLVVHALQRNELALLILEEAGLGIVLADESTWWNHTIDITLQAQTGAGIGVVATVTVHMGVDQLALG